MEIKSCQNCKHSEISPTSHNDWYLCQSPSSLYRKKEVDASHSCTGFSWGGNPVDEDFNFSIRGNKTLIQVSVNNTLIWPEDGSWWGTLEDCPYDWQSSLKTKRRQLEDALRKNKTLLVKCLATAAENGFPCGFGIHK